MRQAPSSSRYARYKACPRTQEGWVNIGQEGSKTRVLVLKADNGTDLAAKLMDDELKAMLEVDNYHHAGTRCRWAFDKVERQWWVVTRLAEADCQRYAHE